MTVRAILDLKGREVCTIAPIATLAAAARLLSDRHIGAVVVTGADARVIGILSERDIVRALAARGSGALEEQVAQAMTRDVITCGGDETISELMHHMTAGRFRHVPVVENERLAGIISIGDVVKYRLAEMEREKGALEEYIRTA
jgi:CBS domain-containing protein